VKTVSIRWYLVMLAGVVAIPMMLFIVLLITQLNQNEQRSLDRRTARVASSVSSAVYLILKDMDSTLDLVASAPELETDDLKGFHYRTQLALKDSGKFVILVDSTGQQLLNTRVPFGEPLGRTSDMASLTQALSSGETVISDVFLGRTSGEWVFNLTKPVKRTDSTAARALIITKNAAELTEALASPDIPQGWNLAIVDRTGALVAGRGDIDVETGAVPDLPAGISELNYYGTATDSSSNTLMGYARIPMSGWYSATWGSIDTAKSSILANWQMLLAGGAILLILFTAVSVYAADRLRKAVTRLARMARSMGEGEIVSPERSRIREIDVVARAMSDASFDRSEAEEQLSTVLGELAHRSKNLLAVLTSMIRQTARHSDSVQTMATALEARIKALDTSIDLLTRNASGSVSLRELVETQTATFAHSPESIRINGVDIRIKADAAQQLGMALHELSTNAVKHGALSTSAGKVTITWSIRDHETGKPQLFLLWTEADGPPTEQPDREGFGQTVIKKHTAAVFRGEVTLDYEATGLRWSLQAPLNQFVESREPKSE